MLAVATWILLGADGPYTERVAPETLRHIRNVAVISDMGGTLQFEQVEAGRWLKPANAAFLAIADWGLDADAARTVTAALSKEFSVLPITFDPAVFSTWNDTLLRRATLDLNGDPAIDAYVLILRDWSTDRIFYTGHDVGGLGVLHEAGGPTALYASYRILLVDALSGNILASRAARLPQERLPAIASADALWPQRTNDLTPSQAVAIREDLRRLIDATLIPTLKKLHLAQ